VHSSVFGNSVITILTTVGSCQRTLREKESIEPRVVEALPNITTGRGDHTRRPFRNRGKSLRNRLPLLLVHPSFQDEAVSHSREFLSQTVEVLGAAEEHKRIVTSMHRLEYVSNNLLISRRVRCKRSVNVLNLKIREFQSLSRGFRGLLEVWLGDHARSGSRLAATAQV